jgi:AcrR family transcriptional regulator
MAQGQPRTKEKNERIADITAAAEKIFLSKGYFSSTIEEIAKEAGVSKGTVYLYFKNKEELYASLMLPSIGEFTQMLLRFETDVKNKKYRTGLEIVMRFHDWLVRLFKNDPEALRILQVYQLLDLSKVMDSIARERHMILAKESIATSTRIFSMAMKQGLLPKMHPSLLGGILWGSFLGIVQDQESKRRTTGKDYTLETLKACFALLGKGLMANFENNARSNIKPKNT